ncbi:hypothetical protein SAMN04487967_2337 [Natronorubrum sediminis]|uniref:DUF4870 domain-containing protein n=1 Tax=Natronorubrum sediminis TaxID=640943 RepID=A0A1H6G051_9EURY|nr:DUF4870 domain-containing protein [Natronorubrum sediminis]SEH15960.1 hypothetical protein SAMN04487967_2337 [Natronorubrum sediminis]
MTATSTTTPTRHTTSSTTLTRSIAAMTHLLALVTWIVGPLIVMWLSRSEYVSEHAKDALNWQLTVGIVGYLAAALVALTVVTGDSTPVLWSSVLAVVVLGGNLLFCVVAAITAIRGDHWEYPVAIRVVETPTVSRTF